MKPGLLLTGINREKWEKIILYKDTERAGNMGRDNFKRVWKGFWQLADPKIWVVSTIPITIGGALAFGRNGTFRIYWFFIALLAVYLIEIGRNAVNEIADYESGVDRWITPEDRTPFSGGKKTIIDGLLTVGEVRMIAILTIGTAVSLGFYIVFYREFTILWIGMAGVFFSVFYSLPPLKLAYRGWGEVIAGATFGPLILCGAYLIMTNTVDLPVLIVSLPISCLAVNILWINQYPDYEADKKGGKKNWVVRLGKKKALNVYAFLFLAAYILIPVICVMFKNPFWLLGLVSLPFASQAVQVARKYYDNTQKLIEANMKTILAYQITGLAMVIAALASRLV